MSSASSAVTYTSVYTDSESGGYFGEPTRSYQMEPLPPVESPEYVAESNPEEDPEEYGNDETGDGPVDYPMDERDDGDDDEGDSSRDNADDRDEEEEEHLAPADSAVVIPTGSRYKVGESFTARPTGGRGIDYGFISTLDAEARRRGIGEIGYGIRDTWVDPTETVPEIAPMTVGEVNTRVTELAELHEHDTQDLYALLKDAQDSRTRISQRVNVDSQRVNLLMEDMIAHQETIQIMEDEAYAAREAWAHSIGLSHAVRSELQTHQEQAELLPLREQPRRARQSGGDARVSDHQDAPRDADSHI
nr:hypothetical protein [Tanacetum cinerariifolium]